MAIMPIAEIKVNFHATSDTMPTDNRQRLGIFWVGVEQFMAMIGGWGDRFLRPVCKNLPVDAKIERVQYDFNRHAFSLCVSHPSFAVVEEGDAIPWMGRLEVELQAPSTVFAGPEPVSFSVEAERLLMERLDSDHSPLVRLSLMPSIGIQDGRANRPAHTLCDEKEMPVRGIVTDIISRFIISQIGVRFLVPDGIEIKKIDMPERGWKLFAYNAQTDRRRGVWIALGGDYKEAVRRVEYVKAIIAHSIPAGLNMTALMKDGLDPEIEMAAISKLKEKSGAHDNPFYAATL